MLLVIKLLHDGGVRDFYIIEHFSALIEHLVGFEVFLSMELELLFR